MFAKIKNTFLSITLSIIVFIHAQAQVPCEDGFANGYPCEKVDLLSIVSPETLQAEFLQGSYLSDIWGWTDPVTNKEYAIVCLINGTSFVDVSDPINPIMLGILPEHHEAVGRKQQRAPGSIWRDAKVYKNHAYIVSEDNGHGMQVFDLTQLRDLTDVPVTFTETAHYDRISNAHNIVINEDTGFAYAVGSTGNEGCNQGGLHIIDINDPVNPTYVGCYDRNGYTHDAQCVIYNGPDTDYQGKEVCINSNGGEIVLVDLSDKANPDEIRSVTYSGVNFAHQGWLTDDHQFFISNDELDEINTGSQTKTLIWDVKDLDSPRLFGVFNSRHRATDHNLYVKDGFVYQSNYSVGLRVLDARGIESLFVSEIAYFDTYKFNDDPGFSGSWSNYPYFESGNVIVTDRISGLFVVRPNLEENPPPVTSIDDIESSIYRVYPNPATQSITIDLLKFNGQGIDVSLFDLNGRLALNKKLYRPNGTSGSSIDVSHLRRGIYHVRISNGEVNSTQRIMLN